MKNLEGKDLTFLIGKKITKVKRLNSVYDGIYVEDAAGYLLTCEDGTEIEIRGNVGCGGCGNGWSVVPDFEKLAGIDNAITNIEVEDIGDEEYEDYRFKMFVIYDSGITIELDGDDGYGNGYYGGGFWVDVRNVRR